jgi:membrane fusion protein (multidrug efflux system)
MNSDQPNTAAPSAARTGRSKALLSIAVVVIVVGAGWAAYEWLVASHYESTDNAYVQGNLIQITPQISGTVTSILADDTDFVKAGQPLIQLDPADVRVGLDQAQANLAQTVRQVRTVFANNGALEAQLKAKEADLAKAQVEIARANDDVQRRQSLTGSGAVSQEEMAHAQNQAANARSLVAAAQAGVVAAREQLNSNQAMTAGTTVETHPSVLAAAARLREAFLASRRVGIPAPVDGYVAKRTVQLGQRVAAGSPTMAVVPLNQLWVDANFKEVQLRQIRIGQPVKLTADLWGKKVEYSGTVAGLGIGTGAAFALLPAQNATGNWIKVVQRVPVRVTLDPAQLAEKPLRIGLSMDATVDVTHQDGPSLAEQPRANAALQTSVYAISDADADALIDKVISANVGHAVHLAQAEKAKLSAASSASTAMSH